MMATLRLRYVHAFVDRLGKPRYYFRHAGQRWPLPGQPGSAEFTQRYDELLRGCKPPKDNVAFGPNTLGYVIEKFIACDGFKRKAHHTRRQYRRILDRLKEIGGRGLMVDLREDHVRQMRSRFLPATFTADEAVMLLSTLWLFAKEHLTMRLGPNPTADVMKLHRQAWSHEPWPDPVIAKFEAGAQPKPNAQLALLLLLYTGQRVGDVAAMRWDRYDGKGITVRQEKTDELLWIPCHSKLKAALDRAERKSDFVLTSQQKRGYSAGSLGNLIMAATARLGAKECSAHGLRKNAANALAEAGCTVHQIMAITGHRTYKQALHYTQRAAQRKLAQQAIDTLESAGKVANS
jgi:integrase